MVYCFSLMLLRLVPSPLLDVPPASPPSSRPPSSASPSVRPSSRAMRSARYFDRWSTVALAVVFTNLCENTNIHKQGNALLHLVNQLLLWCKWFFWTTWDVTQQQVYLTLGWTISKGTFSTYSKISNLNRQVFLFRLTVVTLSVYLVWL